MKKMIFAASQEDHRGNTKTSRRAWIAAAIDLLITEGAAQVKIDRLAKTLGVTRGGFYWFFRNRDDLLDQLIEAWKLPENDPISALLGASGEDSPLDAFGRLFILLVNEEEYNPSFDSALRDWARTSPRARAAVEEVDQRRISLLRDLYERLGAKAAEAQVRARILYYHQVGYYAMDVAEDREERYARLPTYFQLLTGREMPAWVRGKLRPIEDG